MTKEQKEAFLQKRKEKAAKDEAALARVREIEAESRMRKYQCPVCGYSSADNEFLDIYGKSTGECRCRKCGKRFYC
jgi:ribosomal protein L37AE/L43A